MDRHRSALLRLWRENTYNPERNAFARERFEWLYSCAADRVRTWVAIESDTDSVVGCCSVFRSNRYVGGRVIGAGIMALFAVDARHRTGAAALAIQRALTSGGPDAGFQVIVAKPGRKKVPFFERVGYRQLGQVRNWGVRTAILASRSDPSVPPSYRDEIVAAADERFDRLWSSARSHYCIVGEKTAAFLNWRYSGFKENYRFFCLIHAATCELAGYVAFYSVDNHVVIAELLCERPEGVVLEDLLRGLVLRLQREGIDWMTLSFLGLPSVEKALQQVGFTPGHPTKNRTLVYADPLLPEEIRRRLLDEHQWFFFGDETNMLLTSELWHDEDDSLAEVPERSS